MAKVYKITGEFIIAGRDDAAIERELKMLEGQVKTLQRMGMTGIKSWKVINKEEVV